MEQKRQNKQKRRAAFTLAEFLTVIAIVGILASLSFVARNLWFYAPNVPKHTNYDPTAGSYGGGNVQGIDYTSAPSAKRYGFNLKLTF